MSSCKGLRVRTLIDRCSAVQQKLPAAGRYHVLSDSPDQGVSQASAMSVSDNRRRKSPAASRTASLRLPVSKGQDWPLAAHVVARMSAIQHAMKRALTQAPKAARSMQTSTARCSGDHGHATGVRVDLPWRPAPEWLWH